MMILSIATNLRPDTTVWTGIPGIFLTTPETGTTYSLYEVAREDPDTGQLIHEDFYFLEETRTDEPEKIYRPEEVAPEDDGWEDLEILCC